MSLLLVDARFRRFSGSFGRSHGCQHILYFYECIESGQAYCYQFFICLKVCVCSRLGLFIISFLWLSNFFDMGKGLYLVLCGMVTYFQIFTVSSLLQWQF